MSLQYIRTETLYIKLFGIIKILLCKSSQSSKKTVFFLEGIVTVGDLLPNGGVFLKGANVLNANLSPLERFKLMSIVDALAYEWKRIIRQSAQHPLHILVTQFI